MRTYNDRLRDLEIIAEGIRTTATKLERAGERIIDAFPLLTGDKRKWLLKAIYEADDLRKVAEHIECAAKHAKEAEE